MELARPWILLIRSHDVGSADRSQDVAHRLPVDLLVGRQEAEMVELRLLQRPLVGRRDAHVPRLVNGVDARVLTRETIGQISRPVGTAVVDDQDLVLGEHV